MDKTYEAIIAGAKADGSWDKKYPEEDDDIQDYKKPWVGLNDEQRLAALTAVDPLTARLPRGWKLFAEAIEAKLKEKNT